MNQDKKERASVRRVVRVVHGPPENELPAILTGQEAPEVSSHELADEPPPHADQPPEPAQTEAHAATPVSHAGRARALWNWLWRHFLTHPRRTGAVAVGAIALSWVGVLLEIAGVQTAAYVIIACAAFMFLAGILAFLVSISVRLFPGTRFTMQAAIWLALFVYAGLFELVVGAIATAGNRNAIHAIFTNQLASGPGGQVTGAAGGLCLMTVPLLLIVTPEILRRNGQTWREASHLARTRTSAFLATLAAVATFFYAIAEHFFGGPLAGTPLRVLLVGAIAVAAMLAPGYQIMAKACWRHGIVAMLDPARWRETWHTVHEQFAPAFEHIAKQIDAKDYGTSKTADTAPPAAPPAQPRIVPKPIQTDRLARTTQICERDDRQGNPY